MGEVKGDINVPLWLASDKGMTPGAKLLYGRLDCLKGANRVAQTSMGELAEELGVSKRQVQRQCRELERAGLVRVAWGTGVGGGGWWEAAVLVPEEIR